MLNSGASDAHPEGSYPATGQEGTCGSAVFDGDNTYPDCEKCGRCCQLNVLCMSADDFRTIERHLRETHVKPRDYGRKRCCFQSEQNTCTIWEARPQVCRLHNCRIPRYKVLEMDPTIRVDEDLWMVDMHAAFVEGRVV